MTVNAITDTKKGRTGIAPTYLHTTLVSNKFSFYLRLVFSFRGDVVNYYFRLGLGLKRPCLQLSL